ncbi:CG31807 [Drosophila busckii]|uniref:CG31807 n=1 Tax=Drosophila busckii TaxID=30019 RepID=A0A0M4ECP5_DROBS|nr:E3 ubiquitin-protein ligase rnf8-A [Drosophila busckii]ALC43221.1 CG31807 [Drosophila busckii]
MESPMNTEEQQSLNDEDEVIMEMLQEIELAVNEKSINVAQKEEERKSEEAMKSAETKAEQENILKQITELIGERDSLSAILKLQTEEFEQKVTKLDKMRQELLENLKSQEEQHMQQVEQIKLKFQSDLEAKDQLFLELEQRLERQQEHYELDVSCSICLDRWNSTSEHRPVSLRCGHLFGDHCIRSYLQRAYECPQCRGPAQLADLRQIFGRPA